MKIPIPKSHKPKIHDNTEEHLIMTPPSVLENKLEELERYNRAIGRVWSDIGLAITFVIAVVTSQITNLGSISGESIRGAFFTGSIVMLIIVCYDLYRIWNAPVKSRRDVVYGLLKKDAKDVEE
ncbi:MAG: hypothetical protein AAB897_00505 [Patescibacteria group bacterium]